MQLDELRSMGWGKPGGRLLVHKVHVGGDGMGTDGRTTHAGPRSSGRTVPCRLGCRADDDIHGRVNSGGGGEGMGERESMSGRAEWESREGIPLLSMSPRNMYSCSHTRMYVRVPVCPTHAYMIHTAVSVSSHRPGNHART